MAEGSTLQHTVLIKDPFEEINAEIRQKVLDDENMSSRGRSCGGLVRKYRKWKIDHSLDCQDHYSSADDDSSSDEEGKEAVLPVWLQHFMKPTKYIPNEDDDNNSDDGLDTARKMSRIIMSKSHPDYADTKMMKMILSLCQSNDTKDSYVESFMESIVSVKDHNHSIFTIKINLLSIREDIYRNISVPACLSVAIFQEKVLCPLLELAPNLSTYAFYLASNKYVNREKPEELDQDVCIAAVGSSFSMGGTDIERGGQHIIDDRKVALFQILHAIDDYVYYKHGTQRFSDEMPYKISVVSIEPKSHEYDPNMKDVKVIGGRGPVPDESGASPVWDDPRYPDDDLEIGGMKAFCISIDIAEHPSDHADWAVKQARKHLRLKDEEVLDFDKFDIAAARNRVRQATHRLPIKKGAVTNANVFSMLAGNSMPPHAGRMEKCMFCGGREHELGAGKNLRRCGRCRAALYCGTDCQTKDWKTHKVVCVKTKITKYDQK